MPLRWRYSLLLFLYYAVLGALLPLYSLHLKELGFTPLEMGWACSTQALAALVAPLVAGQAADRWFSAERCLAVCACLASVLLWTLARLSAPPAVFLTSLAVWLVLAPASTLCTSAAFAHLPQQGNAFGPVRLWGTVGWVVSGWLIGFWLTSPGWLCSCMAWFPVEMPVAKLPDALRLSGLLSFALCAYALTLPRTPPARRAAAWLAPLAALRLLGDRDFAVFWLCSLGLCATIPFTTQVVPLLLEHLGIPHPWLGPTLTLGQSTEIVSLAVLPALLFRLGTRRTMLLGLSAWAIWMGVLTVGEPVWLVAGSLTLNGLCISCFIVAGQVFVNRRASADVRTSAQALLNFVNGLGMLGGNLLVGWVRHQVQGEFPATFSVAALISLFLLGVLFFGFRPAESTAPAKEAGEVGQVAVAVPATQSEH
jgi:MFS family permease